MGKNTTFHFYVTHYTIKILQPHFGKAVEKLVRKTLVTAL